MLVLPNAYEIIFTEQKRWQIIYQKGKTGKWIKDEANCLHKSILQQGLKVFVERSYKSLKKNCKSSRNLIEFCDFCGC